MSRDVSLDIRMRPLDTKRFVGDFVRKFSARIPEGSPVRTTRDVLQRALLDLAWLDRDFKYSRKTRCWTAHGDQVINARQEDDLRDFIAWCAPYVEPKTARFKLPVEFGEGGYGAYVAAGFFGGDDAVVLCEFFVDGEGDVYAGS